MKAVCLALLFLTHLVAAQNVIFNDSNFKNALLNHSPVIDSNGDGEIQLIEAEGYEQILTVSFKNISDLKGIEAFINISELHCRNNNLRTIDLSSNTVLRRLDVSYNSLSELDIDKNVDLEYLAFSQNNLTNLNLDQNLKLETINGNNNRLSSLDISKNVSLRYLRVQDNRIISLDLNNNPKLLQLSLYNNFLQEIDISNCPNINTFLAGSFQLKNVNAKNGNNTNFTIFNILTSSTNLKSVCVDDVTYATNNFISVPSGTYFTNTFCSRSDCSAYSIGYSSSFEDAPIPHVNLCWAKFPESDSSWSYVKSTENGHSGNSAINMRSTPSSPAYLISPRLVGFGSDKRISFWIQSFPKSSLEIGTMSNPSDKNTFVSYREIKSKDSEGNKWRKYSIDFAEYSGSDNVIAFKLSGYAILTLDDFQYENSPSCMEAVDLISNISFSAETILDWTDYGGASNWDLEYGEVGFVQGSGTSVNVNSKPFVLTNLNPSTEYEFIVKSNCSVGDESGWSKKGVFTTICEAKDPGFNYAFEDENIRAFYDCWRVFANTSRILGGNKPSSTQCLGITSNRDPHIIVTPELVDLNSSKRLKLWVNNYDGDSGITIGTVADPNDESTFSAYRTIDASQLPVDEWKKIIVNFDTYFGVDRFIAIKQEAPDSGSRIYIDDITFQEIPSCLEPTNLKIATITDTEIGLEWTEQASAQNWDIEYGITGFNLGEGTRISTSSVNRAIIGLTPDIRYDIYVRSVCGNNDESEWVGIYQVNTTCGPMMLDYKQNFDLSNPMPNCWSTLPLNYGGIEAYDSEKYGDEGFSLKMNCSQYTPEIYLISPEFTDLGVSNNRIKFWLYSRYSNSDLIIGTMSDPLNENSFEPIETIVGTEMSQRQWDPVTVNLDSYTGSNKYIAFKQVLKDYESYTYDVLYIDRFEYSAMPSCKVPTEFEIAEMTDGDVTLRWQENNNASEWEIEYGLEGFWQGEGTLISTTSNLHVIDGLLLDTEYDFYVRSKCGNSNYSDWSSKLKLDTSCGNSMLTGYAYNFDDASIDVCWTAYEYPAPSNYTNFYMSSYIHRGDSGYSARLTATSISIDVGTIMVSPMLSDLSSDKKITFWQHSNSGGLTVGTMSNPNDYRTFHPLLTIERNEVTSNWEEKTVYLRDYNGHDKYIAFRQKRISYSTGEQSYIDDFSYLQSINCTDLTNFNVSEVSETEATLSWESTGPESEWEINYRIEGAPDDKSISIFTSDKNYVLDNLDGNSTYEIKVRAICDVGLFSHWASQVISTPCDLGEDNFSESFEYEGELDLCWSKIILNGNNLTRVRSLESFGSGEYPILPAFGNRFMTLNHSYDSSSLIADILLVSKEISDIDNNKRLKISLISRQGNAKSGYYNRSSIQVGTISDPSDPSTFNLIQTIAPEEMSEMKFDKKPGTDWKEHTIYFDDYVGSDRYIAIKHGDEYYGSQFFIDDFVYENIPECTEPLYPEVLYEYYDAVDVTWEVHKNSSPQSWQVQYGSSGFEIGTGTTVEAMSSTFKIENLQDNTDYDFYVRSYCGNFYSEWSVKQEFTTKCSGFEVGYFENFDSQESGFVASCWTGLRPVNTNKPYWDGILNNVSVVDSAPPNSYPTHSGTNVVRLYNAVNHPDNDAVSDKIVLVSPRLIGLDNYKKISFWMYPERNVYANPTEIIIGTLSDPDDYTTFTPYHIILNAGDAENTWAKYEINFSDYALTDEYIGIKQASINDVQVILIDDFEYTENGCVTPTDLQAHQSSPGEVTLSWQDNNTQGAPENWEIEYGLKGFEPGSGTLVTANSNPFVLSNLNNFENYDYYVRAYCNSADGFSNWGTPYSFTVTCAQTAPFYENFDALDASYQFDPNGIPNFCWIRSNRFVTGILDTESFHSRSHSLPNAAYVNQNIKDTRNLSGYLASPFLSDFDNTKIVKLWLRNEDNARIYRKSGVIIGTMSNPLDRTTFVPFKRIEASEIPLFGKEFLIDFSGYTGTDKHIAIVHDELYDLSRVYIDDFYYKEMPSCLEPINIKSNNITDNSVTVSWENYGISSSFEVEYGLEGFTHGSGTIISTQNENTDIQELDTETSYEYYIRSVCGNGTYSEWIGPHKVVTTCTFKSLPWVENFDKMSTYGPSILPECFNGVPQWVSSNTNLSPYQVGENDTHYLYLIYDEHRNKNSLITPAFKLEAGTTYDLEFKIRKEAGDYSAQSVNIRTGMGNTHDIMVTHLNYFSDFNFGFYEYYPIKTTFTPVVSGTYSFGLYFRFSSPISTISVDSFSLSTAYENQIEITESTPLVLDFENGLDEGVILEKTEFTVNEIITDQDVSGKVVNMRLKNTLDYWVNSGDNIEKWVKNQNGINKIDFEINASDLDELFLSFDLKQTYFKKPEESIFRVIVNGQIVLDNVYPELRDEFKTSELENKFRKTEYKTYELDLSGFTGGNIRVSLQQLGRYLSETNGFSDEVFLDNLSFNSGGILGALEASFSNLRLYPNPTNDVLHIANIIPVDSVDIINIFGQKVYSRKFNKKKMEINFSNLPSSVYFVTLYANGLEKTYKVVKD